MRDFVVLVRETVYNSSKDKYFTKLENINVLVGPKAAVDKMKKTVEDFLEEFKGTFTTNFRCQGV
jgi:hypothetical protein